MCFSLFEAARVKAKSSELAETLRAYREVIVDMARRHKWEFVSQYDRYFREEAAGKSEMVWNRADATLLVREVSHPEAKAMNRDTGGLMARGGQASASMSQRRDRKQPGVASDLTSKHNGLCSFGQQCRFVHA